jgi:hypothetical protein
MDGRIKAGVRHGHLHERTSLGVALVPGSRAE